MWLPKADAEAVREFARLAEEMEYETEDPEADAQRLLEAWYLLEVCIRRGISLERLTLLTGSEEEARRRLVLLLEDPRRWGIVAREEG